MGVEAEEERDEEMVSVPKRLKRLLTDTSVGAGKHEQHAEKHDVTSDTTRLSIVNLKSRNGSDLSDFDVVKVDVVSACVKAGEEKHGIGELAVHPQVLIEREEANLGSNPSHNGSAYGEENKHAVDTEN